MLTAALPGEIFDKRYYFHNYGNMEKQAIDKQSVIAALGALAQETRLDVFRRLVQAGAAGVPAGGLGEQLGIPNATLSFHLQQLRHAGLVSSQRKGTQIIYAANYTTMNELLGYLTENCCQGDDTCCLPVASCDCEPIPSVTKNP